MKLTSKWIQAALFASVVAATVSAQHLRAGEDIVSQNDRNLLFHPEHSNGLGQMKKKVMCTGLIQEIQMEDYTVDVPAQPACELQDGKILKVDAPDGWFQENRANGNFKSGEVDLTFDDAEIDETAQVIKNKKNNMKVPPGLAKKENSSRRKLYAVLTGERTVLVVRVIAADNQTSFSEGQLSDSVFGNNGDPVNLKSQYLACSHNQLNFTEASDRVASVGDNDISVGAVTVAVSTTTSEGDAVMRNAITAELKTMFNVSDVRELANHVMYCMPPGTMSGIAYAYVNWWLSVYSNQWCTYLSGQMHELGHNLNFAHSNEAGTYRDQSGMMGYSYSNNNGPLMCFNAAKSWQSPWYDSCKLTISTTDGATHYTGQLGSIVSNPAPTGTCLIKFDDTTSATDYYMTFNWASGFNSGTVEGKNLVMIARAGGEGVNYAESELVAKLAVGGSYSISDFASSGQNLTVTVNAIDTTNGYADIEACIGPCPTPAPTPAPVAPTPAPVDPTPAPVDLTPSSEPSLNPSGNPSSTPSQTPSEEPSSEPSLEPSGQPSMNPTATTSPSTTPSTSNSPSLSPSSVPSDVPSMNPSDAPSTEPSSGPSLKPSTLPSENPTATASDAPSTRPTGSPSLLPSDVPSTLPSAAPTSAPTETCIASGANCPSGANDNCCTAGEVCQQNKNNKGPFKCRG